MNTLLKGIFAQLRPHPGSDPMNSPRKAALTQPRPHTPAVTP
ncbi:hypothetical protein [Streptomyces griseorubiginosus]|nr:hypothetical protein [Streptomyces griseorubiginosus]